MSKFTNICHVIYVNLQFLFLEPPDPTPINLQTLFSYLLLFTYDYNEVERTSCTTMPLCTIKYLKVSYKYGYIRDEY